MDLTYGEMRSNAEKIADEQLKQRVLHGLELLQEKFGDAWVEHIDPDALDMSHANMCVLGQVFGRHGLDVEPTWEEIERVRGRLQPSLLSDLTNGFVRGVVVLDGDLLPPEEDYGYYPGVAGGFNIGPDEEAGWRPLQEAWLVVFGEVDTSRDYWWS